MANIVWSFGGSECNRVKVNEYTFVCFFSLLQSKTTFVTSCLNYWAIYQNQVLSCFP